MLIMIVLITQAACDLTKFANACILETSFTATPLLEVHLGDNAAVTVADIEALRNLHSKIKFKT